MGKKKVKKNSAKSEPRDAKATLDLAPFVIAFLFVAFFVFFAFIGTFRPWELRIQGVDPVGYFAWTHTLVFDRDLDFENEYRALNRIPIPGDTLVDPDGPRTATGRLGNSFSMGPGLLWVPYIAFTHVIAWAGGADMDPLSQPYQTAVFYANIVYVFFGALLLYYTLLAWYDRKTSLLAAVAMWLCSPLLYYTYAQEAMSHACSFFAVALALFTWVKVRERSTYLGWALLGLTIGLATLVRWQNVTFAIIPAVDLLRHDGRRNVPRLATAALTTVLIFSPQMLAWRILYGSFFTIPQGGEFMDWAHPDLIALFFSRAHGLILWTPLCALGMLGIFVPMKPEHRAVYTTLLLAFLVQLYIQACAGNVGWAFGMRRMINCVPLMAIGAATLLDRARIPLRLAVPLAFAFALWNVLFVAQYGGILDEYYMLSSFEALARDQGISPEQLFQSHTLKGGQPFDALGFMAENTFPKGRPLTFDQFVTDKALVVREILFRLLLLRDSP